MSIDCKDLGKGSLAGQFTRRGLFDRVSDGVFGAALAALMARDARGESARSHDLLPKQPHFPAKATAVIHLCMQGGPSQVDLFDPKTRFEEAPWTIAPARVDGQCRFRERPSRQVDAEPVGVPAARRIWRMDLRVDASLGAGSGSVGDHTVNVQRSSKPRTSSF